MLVILLAFLGLCFGSFVNALTWRLKNQKDWVKARSQCPDCGHELAAKDLIPVLSWLLLKGKCRYCGRSISWQYPLVELAAATVFVASYLFWPQPLQGGQVVLFISWLASAVGLIALAVYDFRWMLLPNKLIYPSLAMAAAGNLIYLLFFADDRLHFAVSWLGSILVASGIFLILFLASKGRWIGYGDVRLGLVTGTLLHSVGQSLLMIFLASLLGTLIVMPSLLAGKKSLSQKLPYGPLLIAGAFISLIWGEQLVNWYKRLFLP